MSNIGPIVKRLSCLSANFMLISDQMVKALFNNKPCFFEEPRWQEFMRPIIGDHNSPSERSKMVLSLYIIIRRIPSLFKDITNTLSGDVGIEPLYT